MHKHDVNFTGRSLARLLGASAVAALLGGMATPPAQADDLVIGLGSNMTTLDPTNAQVVGTDVSLMAHLYSSLVRRQASGELVGDLATSWEAIDDHTWKFTLREDVVFPNGKKLDAEVVKWNIERMRDPATKSRNRAWFAAVERVEVVSPTEVRVITSQAYPALPAQLTMLFFLEPGWVAEHNAATETMGTGAFELVEYDPGQSILLTARKGYYGKAPAFDRLRYRIVPEAAARVAGVETGELDLALDIPLEDIETLDGRDGIKAGWVQSARTMSVRINTTVEPLASNIELRKALNYAIDKESIVNNLLEGKGTVSACQVISSDYFGHNPDLKPYPYDPEKAREIIAASGIGNQPIELQVPTGRYFMASEIGQIVAGQLEEVGLKVVLREYDFATWVKPYAAGQMGPLALMGQSWPTLDASGLLTLYTSGNVSGYFKNPNFDEAVKAASATVDPQKRQEAFRQATQLFCDAAPVIFLFHQPLTYATSADVNWAPRGDDWVLVDDFSAKK